MKTTTWTMMVAAFALSAAGCQQKDAPVLEEQKDPAVAARLDKVEPTQVVTFHEGDKPGTYNEGELTAAKPTAMDQGNSQGDLDVTQAIRKALMADDSLSMGAKNAQIITKDGVVTLKGVARNNAERTNLVAKARSVAGVARVDNMLEVKPSAD